MKKAAFGRSREDVLIGPKLIGDTFYRVVSFYGGVGRVERYDASSGSWAAAPQTITANDVWKAPSGREGLKDLLEPPASGSPSATFRKSSDG